MENCLRQNKQKTKETKKITKKLPKTTKHPKEAKNPLNNSPKTEKSRTKTIAESHTLKKSPQAHIKMKT